MLHAVVFSALAAVAAPTTIDVPVTSTRLGLAPGSGVVASNGDEFLAVYLSSGQMFGRRFSISGQPIDERPFFVADAANFDALASDGHDFLLVETKQLPDGTTSFRPTRIGSDGHVTQAPPIAAGHAFAANVIWSGSHYMLVWGNIYPATDMDAMLVDRDGNVASAITKFSTQERAQEINLALMNSGDVGVLVTGSYPQSEFIRLSEASLVGTRGQKIDAPSLLQRSALATTGSEFLMVRMSSRNGDLVVIAQRTDASGAAIAPPHEFATKAANNRVYAAWDGGAYYVTWTGTDQRMVARRLRLDGSEDVVPTPEMDWSAPVGIAASRSSVFPLIASTGEVLYADVVSNGASLGAVSGPIGVSKAFRPSYWVASAACGARTLLLTREDGPSNLLRMSVIRGTVVEQEFDVDGTLTRRSLGGDAAISCSDQGAIVVYPDAAKTLKAVTYRVGDGVERTASLALAPLTELSSYPTPRAIWTGADWIVVWADDYVRFSGLYSSNLFAARVGSNGDLLQSRTAIFTPDDKDAGNGSALAPNYWWSGTELFATVWNVDHAELRRTTRALTPLTAPQRLLTPPVSISSSGNGFAILGVTGQLQRFDASGNAVDAMKTVDLSNGITSGEIHWGGGYSYSQTYQVSWNGTSNVVRSSNSLIDVPLGGNPSAAVRVGSPDELVADAIFAGAEPRIVIDRVDPATGAARVFLRVPVTRRRAMR